VIERLILGAYRGMQEWQSKGEFGFGLNQNPRDPVQPEDQGIQDPEQY
jgi:hypothetical protein